MKHHQQRIANKGDHFDISLDDEYVDNIFHKMKLNKCNPATTTGKANVEDEQLLDHRSINNCDDLSENYNGWHTPGQTSATQRKNLQEHFNNQSSKTRRNYDIWSGTLQGQKGYKFSTGPTIKLYDKTPQQLEHLCRLRLSRMSSDKMKHNRLCHRATWHLHPLWITNTRSGSLIIS